MTRRRIGLFAACTIALLVCLCGCDARPKTLEDWGRRSLSGTLDYVPGTSGEELVLRVENTSRLPVSVSRIALLQVQRVSEHRTVANAPLDDAQFVRWFILPGSTREMRFALHEVTFRGRDGTTAPAIEFVERIPESDRQFLVCVKHRALLSGTHVDMVVRQDAAARPS